MDEKPEEKYWHLVLGDSRFKDTYHAVKTIAKTKKPDLIFIDTHHTYEHVTAELINWLPFSKHSTVWLFHDTWMMGEYNHMTDAIKQFAKDQGFIYEDLSTESHGLGVVNA